MISPLYGLSGPKVQNARQVPHMLPGMCSMSAMKSPWFQDYLLSARTLFRPGLDGERIVRESTPIIAVPLAEIAVRPRFLAGVRSTYLLVLIGYSNRGLWKNLRDNPLVGSG